MFAPANFNQNGAQYQNTANDNTVIIVQIETRTAVQNVEEIAGTDGIGKHTKHRSDVIKLIDPDMLFIGPNDLAASLGYFPFDHAKIEEVQIATARTLKACKDADKYAGHFALSAEIGETNLLLCVHD